MVMSDWKDDENKLEKPPGDVGEYCEKCHATGMWISLIKCPMCHKYVCDECKFSVQGKDFCSRFCANEFFWGETDEEE